MMLAQLFLSFLQIGLFSIGGGYAAMPLIQQQVVEQHAWLTMSEFTDLVTIAEMTPGPIAVNAASFVGMNLGGVPGAIVATLGCITPSLVIVSLLSWIYRRYRQMDTLQEVLGCLRPAVVALIASAGLDMVRQAIFAGRAWALDNLDGVQLLLFAGALVALRKGKRSPVAVMLGCGVVSLLVGLVLQTG